MSVSRRELLAGAVATGAAAALGALRSPLANASPAAARPLPSPASSGLDHIVFLCMENRSFDHYLGWLPGANGRQSGLTYHDDVGAPHATHHLTEWTGCGFNDPDHSYKGGRVQYDAGRCDGFRRGRNDDYALGYYGPKDLPTMAQLAHNFTVFDRWFAGMLGPTYPNRLYTHSASTDRIRNFITPFCTLPTIWDRLAAAGVPATYYYSDLPVLALYGGKYGSISKPIDSFFTQAANGTLPSYSYLDPAFFTEQNDDHPHADIRRGQNLIARIVKAVLESPQWGNTALVITYDEWGGFFDHVPPPRFPDDVENKGGGENRPDHAQAGFRVPAFLISPFARRQHVAHTTFEHSAILKLAEWRFGLAPLTRRDAASRNIASVLDFSRPNLKPPAFSVPPDPGASPCGAEVAGTSTGDDPFWQELAGSRALASFG